MKPDITPLPPFDAAQTLRKHGLRPDKSLGQNFLQDDAALRTITSVAELSVNDTVLEIGPGLGSLTRYLAANSKEVVAVELDSSLMPILKNVMQPFGNVRMINEDILKLEISDLIKDSTYLVVANIPYYITSAIIRHLLESTPKPRRIVLTVQKEVAHRICAKPGDMSLLALSVQVYGHPQIAAGIPAEAFYPTPKVDSAVICMDTYPEPVIPDNQLDLFFKLAKAGFSQKRKTLRNSLSAGLSIPSVDAEKLLASVGIDPKRRAETLSLQEWAVLTSNLQANL